MNRLVHMAAAGSLLAFGASAQEPELARKLKAESEANMVQMKTVGAVRGMTVKNSPYSAEEVTESSQMLADGTRIHRENRTQVFRDSEGRTRRETPDNITITDPVANVTYLLNPKTMTGQKLAMAQGNFMFLRDSVPARSLSSVTGDGPSTFSIHTSGDGPTTITLNGIAMDEKAVAEAMAKAKASGTPQTITYERHEIITDGVSSSTTTSSSGSASATSGVRVAGVGAGGGVGVMTATAGPMQRINVRRSANAESLGKQVVEGVSADGTREVSTIPAGSIGNDRPIAITNESWYSDELQMMVSSKRSDPRTGDETFRLTNIRRGEPGAYLFQAPTGYQISEPKGGGGAVGIR